jgi:hypothetical protein
MIQLLIPFFLTLLIGGVFAVFAGYIWSIAIPLLAHLLFFALAGYISWKYLLPLLGNALHTRTKISYYEMIAVTIGVIVLFGLSIPSVVFSPVGDAVTSIGMFVVPEEPSIGFAVFGLLSSIAITLYVNKSKKRRR